jgi:hypothetical protein
LTLANGGYIIKIRPIARWGMYHENELINETLEVKVSNSLPNIARNP